MKHIAIQVQNLGKQYHIGRTRQKHPTLRDQLVNGATAPFRRAGKLLRGQATGAAELDQKIWALTNVSFEVERGEVIGIIGHNGAGKSTLLKILSRITEPTVGFARIRGRISSLLEVGTGFHNELTGRENVYLNGAILGMRRAEIDRKFDEIVAFSEVEKFVETPVKHYSSGMKLRLAFAVAAHLEPEILIIDEVLAVGDARFQRRCIDKMQDVGQRGRTVLFVSHNMPAVTRLCQRVILLNEGRILDDGPAHNVVSEYLNSGLGTTAVREYPNPTTAPGDKIARLRAVRVRNEQDGITDVIDIRTPVSIEMEYEVLTPGHVLLPNFHLSNEDGIRIFTTLDQDQEWRRQPRPKGVYVSKVQIPGNFLTEGTLFVDCNLTTVNKMQQFKVADAVAFQVVDSIDGDSARGDWGGDIPGLVRPLLAWDTEFSSNGGG